MDESTKTDTAKQTGSAATPTGAPAGGGIRMVAVMGLVGLIASVILVTTYTLTAPYIEANRAIALERAIFDVLPGTTHRAFFEVSDEGILIPVEEAPPLSRLVYAGYDSTGALIGVAFEGSGQGFQDVLKILIGYRPDCQCVVGMKVLESKETPGLGDKIEKDPSFKDNLARLDVRLTENQEGLAHAVELVKRGAKTDAWQVEGITGATISSRAVVRIIDANAGDLIPVIEKNLDVLRGGNE